MTRSTVSLEATGLTVGDLVGTTQLRLEVLAGGDGLDRVVTWSHVSELEDPAAWLEGGEFLMTNGLGLPEDPGRQADLITRLADRGVAAFGVGVRGPKLSRRMLAEADDRRFPVLRIPYEVPFVSIAHLVGAAVQGPANRRLLTYLRLFETLRPEDDQLSTEQILDRLCAISGYELALVAGNGRPLVPSTPPPDVVADAVRAHGASDRVAPAIPGGYVLRVPLPARSGLFLIALARESSELLGLSGIGHIATIVSFHLTRAYHEREVARRAGAESLSRLLAGRLERPILEATFATAGLALDEPIVIGVLRARREEIDDNELHHRLCDAEVPHLMTAVRDELLVLLPVAVDPFLDAVSDLELAVGISRPLMVTENLAMARREAGWAIERAMSSRSPGTTASRFAAADRMTQWLPQDPVAVMDLVEDALAPLLRYDEAHNTSLVESLRLYLEHDRSLQASAAALHVHKHTLAYRLKRIQEISGRKLTRSADLVEMWLALQAYEISRANEWQQMDP